MAVATFAALKAVETLNGAVQTKAVVIDLDWVELAEGPAVFPVFRRVDAEGVEHTVESNPTPRALNNCFLVLMNEPWLKGFG
jgi:hypothetical protein